MLRTTCQFQRKGLLGDGKGGFLEQWSNLSGAATRCAFKAMSGSERFMSQRAEATTKNRITVRFFADLRESDRVVINGRAYGITFVNNVELRNRWLVTDLDGGVAS